MREQGVWGEDTILSKSEIFVKFSADLNKTWHSGDPRVIDHFLRLRRVDQTSATADTIFSNCVSAEDPQLFRSSDPNISAEYQNVKTLQWGPGSSGGDRAALDSNM